MSEGGGQRAEGEITKLLGTTTTLLLLILHGKHFFYARLYSAALGKKSFLALSQS